MLKVAEFAHLHVHTEYSLLDGMIRLEDLIDKAEKFQMPAVAMTDHGNLFGAVKFYEAAKKKGIKPIVGCEVYVAPNNLEDRDAVGNHLVLLCKNYKGYQNLCKMVTESYVHGFYYKPRVDKRLIEECNEGLIALSACLKGEVAEALIEEDVERAADAASWFKEVFDNKRYYLELQENGIKEQKDVNRGLLSLSARLEIPVVATNDCHYLDREMAKAHEALLCIQTGKTLSDEKRMRMSTDEFYFKSPGEMKERFAEIPEAIDNTMEIASRCNLDWSFEAKHYPVFPVPGDMTIDEHFEEEVMNGFEERYEDLLKSDPDFEKSKEKYLKRLEYEKDVIVQMGFPGYFMIVADFINWAKEQEIPVGPGRGSAAGSLVSYCLGITDLNPLPYDLIFERFLNPERRELPDIDTDFCQERRGEVLRYVTERYGGAEYVAQIITFGTMKSKAVVRDVGRVMSIPYADVDRIAKLIPDNATLQEAYKQEPRLKEAREKDPKTGELLKVAESLEGISRHASTHAAGVVISDAPLINYLPLYKDSRGEEVVAQYDMKCVEKVGLIKFDLLGLKTLTVIKYCLDFIKENQGVEVDIGKIPLDDKKAYDLLGQGDTGGVFQLESSGMKDVLQRLLPSTFEDIIAVVALYRPGPLGGGYVDKFIERKHGRQKVEYALPQMEDLLRETYGVLVYQEQVMRIAVELADYSMGEADKLRKAMGKKIPELMEAQKDKFLSGAKKNNIPEKTAKAIFDDMAQFAHYGFNKSHAAAYSLVAYQTAYLKAHYPVAFMAALLTMDMGNTEKVVRYLAECEKREVEVVPPNVNWSVWEFRAEGDKVRFGLGAVKGVGRGAVEAIIEGREEAEYRSIYDFCERVDLKRVNKRTLEGLIRGGAFDGLGPDRASMMAAVEGAVERGQRAARERDAGQTNIFEMMGESVSADFAPETYPEVTPWTSTELLSGEKEALGFYLTGHPLARFESLMKRLGVVETSMVPYLSNGQQALVGGVLTGKKVLNRKGSNEQWAFITLTDLKGSIDVAVFSSLYRDVVELLEEEDVPLLVRGTVDISEDRVRVKAGEIMRLEDAPSRLSLTLHLTLKRPAATAEQVEQIANILKKHEGRTRVVAHVIIPGRSETLVSLPAEYRTSPDREIIEALEELLGEGSVKMVAA